MGHAKKHHNDNKNYKVRRDKNGHFVSGEKKVEGNNGVFDLIDECVEEFAKAVDDMCNKPVYSRKDFDLEVNKEVARSMKSYMDDVNAISKKYGLWMFVCGLVCGFSLGFLSRALAPNVMRFVSGLF